MPAGGLRDLGHWVKRRVIRLPGLRSALRRLLVTPYQLWHFRRLVRWLPAPSAGGAGGERERPVVLILALRHWAISRAWETAMSRVLIGLGCRPVWAECDELMLRCDSMMGAAREPDLCAHCVRFNHRVDVVAGVERASLLELAGVSREDRLRALERAGRSPAEPDLARHTHASLQRILAGRVPGEDDLDDDQRAIRAELMASGALVRRAAGPLFERVDPDAVIALNGKFFAEALLLAEAGARGIPVWTYERGNRRDTVAMSPKPVAIPFDTGDILERLGTPLAPDERRRIDDYLAQRTELGNGQVRFIASGATADLPFLAGAERVVSLFTNLVWDSSVVGEDTIFEDMFDWIETTVAELQRQPGTHLLIRVHPAETSVYWHPTRERVGAALAQVYPRGLPPRVSLIDAEEPVDSYALLDRSDLVLVYASTVGMEAAAFGKRVIAACNSNFSAAPFVATPADRASYLRLLRQAGAEPVVPDAAELARRFMYHLYLEKMVPVPVVREDPTGFHTAAAADDDGAFRRLMAGVARTARRHAAARATDPA